MTQAKFHKVPSETRPDVTYTVVERPDGTWSCSCPAHAFKNRDCKHIQQVRDGITPQSPQSGEKTASSPQTEQAPEKRYGKQKLTWQEMLDRVKQMGANAPKEDEFEKDVRKYVLRDEK